MPQLRMQQLLITPPMAEEMLKKNSGNRVLNHNRIRAYAENMRRSNWRLTGDSIKFSGGFLKDGQHRLLGCVMAGVPFETVVIDDVDEDAMIYTDTGQAKTMTHVLAWKNVKDPANVGSSVKLFLMWQSGFLRDPARAAVHITRDIQADHAVDHLEQWHRSVGDGRRLRKTIGMSLTWWAAASFAARNVDDELAEYFLDRLVDGANLHPGSPVLALRNWVNNRVATGKHTVSWEFLGVFTKAWNAFLEGRSIQVVRMLASEDLPTHLAGA